MISLRSLHDDDLDESADAGEPRPADLLHGVYAFFYNKRTGLVLILAMTVLTLFGVLFAQAPDSVRGDPEAYAAWLEAVRPRYRGWTEPLSWLGIFRMFGSIPFLVVASALALSILACSLHRTPLLWRQATRPRVHGSAGLFDHARTRVTRTVDAEPDEARAALAAALRRRRFRVLEAGPGGLFADRNRFAPLGAVIAHLAFVVILAGVLISSTSGFADREFTVTVGTTAAVGHGTGLSVELTSFRDEYYPDGTPKDYASELVIHRHGQQVAAQTVRVNSPLEVDGISFNQAFFGIAAVLTIAEEDGRTVFAGGVPLRWNTSDGLYTYGKVTLTSGQEVYVVSAASGQADRSLAPGQVRVEVYPAGGDTPEASEVLTQGTPVTVAGLSYTFERERQFTGLIVSRDPGAAWVWAGAVLLMLGTCWTMFCRHRRLWVRVQATDDGAELSVACPDRPDAGFENEIRELVDFLPRTPVDHREKAGQSHA